MSNNLEINQGADYTRTATVLNAANVPINLTGYSVSAQIRKNSTSSTYVAFSTAVTDVVNGKISISLTHTQTAAMAAGKYEYDIFIIGTTAQYKVTDGIITLIPRITR